MSTSQLSSEGARLPLVELTLTTKLNILTEAIFAQTHLFAVTFLRRTLCRVPADELLVKSTLNCCSLSSTHTTRPRARPVITQSIRLRSPLKIEFEALRSFRGAAPLDRDLHRLTNALTTDAFNPCLVSEV